MQELDPILSAEERLSGDTWIHFLTAAIEHVRPFIDPLLREFGYSEVADEALAIGWLEQRGVDQRDVERLIAECDEACPDTQELPDLAPLTFWFAAVVTLLQILLNRHRDRSAVSSLLENTILTVDSIGPDPDAAVAGEIEYMMRLASALQVHPNSSRVSLLKL